MTQKLDSYKDNVVANGAQESESLEDNSMVTAVADVMNLSNLYIHKNYLQNLDKMPIVPANEEIRNLELGKNLRLLRISGILHDKNESLSEKVKSLFGAISTFDAGVMLILQAKSNRVEFYVGICTNHGDTVNQVFNDFKSTLNGILPGCKYRNVKKQDVNNLIEEIFPGHSNANSSHEKLVISAVSTFPIAIDKPQSTPLAPYEAIEKIDVLLDGMRGKPFSMILLTKTLSRDLLIEMQQQLELLYTQLSMFERQTFSTSESDSDSVTLNYSHAVTSNQGYNTGFTCGISNTHSETHVKTEPDGTGRKIEAGLGLLGTAASLAVPLAATAVLPASMALAGVAFGAFLGNSISSLGRNAGILSGVIPNPKQINNGIGYTKTESESKNYSFSVSKGTTDSSGYAIGNNRTLGTSRQYTVINKSVNVILEELDKEIHQVQRLSREGAFYGAAYFIAGNTENALTAANIYRSMTESKVTGTRTSSQIHHWNEPNKVHQLIEYLSRGCHPTFELENEPHKPTVEAAQIIGINDVPIYFSFPKKSVPGVVISNYAGFSRDVILQYFSDEKADGNRTIHTGYIFHLGKIETQTPINLQVDEMTKHVLVSGATGVGKSNFCYQLLDQLTAQDIKALIIEPAKGEYASVLGGREDFSVYGTDIMRAPLLKINPFAFPDGITATQHIERLISIFNTAWSMYDAMPALLKEAIEKIYLDKGFDLDFGYKPEDAPYPNFGDLLKTLPVVIKNSDYSAEIKGNYTGALVTRLKSLTNGLYRMLFTADELGDKKLFTQNVIIDISRVGSPDTKALIMGILTMKLSEFRMSEGMVNSPLRHVTLLEEAHHLLRKDNISSTANSNLQSASVEMISNAIAEMRTYGEGFIIADQSPSVLDPSVIRNTHTKVFFMLPDRQDREIPGDSLTLTEPQKQELARLSPGVALVYQNGWTNPVLCKINHFKKEKEQPFSYEPPKFFKESRELISQALAVILSRLLPESIDGSVNSDAIEKLWCNVENLIISLQARAALEVLTEYRATGEFNHNINECQQKISALIPLKKIILETSEENWAAQIEEKLLKEADLNEAEQIILVQLGVRWFLPKVQASKMYTRYFSYKKECSTNGKEV